MTAPVSSRLVGPFSTGSCYEPVLKGPLTPGRKKAEVFGDFGHRPMPYSVVVVAQQAYADQVGVTATWWCEEDGQL